MSLLSPIYNAVTALGALLTRLTAERAAAIDRLDANVSTRAPASTALSTATWTNTRAGKLDQLDATVTSRSSHSAADVWAAGTRTLTAAPSVIKSIQTGLVDTSSVSSGTTPQEKYVNITLSAVVVAKAMVIHSVLAASGDDAAQALANARKALVEGAAAGVTVAPAQAYLASTTQLRIYTGITTSSVAFSGRWQVVEYQ